jgi:hypothetical protein
MDIISPDQQVESYQGAAELCGTTHRTAEKVIERFEAGESAPLQADRPITTMR